MKPELTPISLDESRELVRCEKIITTGRKTFVEVGEALCTIRDKKLYRHEFGTFEAYLRVKWGWSRMHAGRLIEAAAVVNALPAECNQLVTSEAKARELAKAPPADRPAVLEKAAASAAAESRPVTARDIAEAAEPPLDGHALAKLVARKEAPAVEPEEHPDQALVTERLHDAWADADLGTRMKFLGWVKTAHPRKAR